jgi:hypothetical protein
MRASIPVAFLAVSLLATPSRSSAESTASPPKSTESPGAAAPQSKSLAPAKPPSDQARALSRALVPQQSWERLLDRSADGLSEAVSRSLQAKGEKVPDNLRTTLRNELAKDMKYGEAVDAQASALEKRFTGDEMSKAAAFYSSPLGKKMLDKLPEAQSEVGDQLQERLATVVPGILQRVAPSALGQGSASAPPKGTGAGGGDVAQPAPPPPGKGM